MGIEKDFMARRDAGALDAAWPRWLARRESLRRFADPEDLVAACRDRASHPWEEADAGLAALCLEARGGDETAASLLLWLVLPGLLRLRSRLARSVVLPPEDLDAELLAGIWEAASVVQASTRRVASRLLNTALWRALNTLREALRWAETATPLAPELEDRAEFTAPSPEPGDALAGAVREGAVSSDEMELLLTTRRTIGKIAAQLGISLSAAQGRRHRARERLLAWLGRRREPARRSGAVGGSSSARAGATGRGRVATRM